MVQRRAARFITWPTGREPQNGPTQGYKVHHLTNRQGTSKWSNAGLQGSSPDQQAGNLKMVQRRAAKFITWTTGREPLNGPMQGCKVYHLTNRQGTSKWTNAGLQGSSPDQQAGNMHVVLVICFNTWTGSVWKTSVKMLDLTWCI
jgi:hypothetical protein